MDKITYAINLFNEEKFSEGEKIALEIFEENPQSVEALDVLAAIFLRINHLEFLDNAGKKELDLIRKLAFFLYDLQTFEQAAVFFQKALEIYPVDYVALANLGLVFEELDNLKKAENCYLRSLKIKFNYPAAYNLGVLYRKTKELAKSINYLEKAAQENPNNAYAHYSLGMSYFMNKEFQKGYPEFLRRPVQYIEGLKNIWTGEKHEDKTLLIYCEYGLGDAIMFSRYFPLLKEYFAKITVCCKPALISLFKASFSDIEFVSSYTEASYDYSVLSMDLPYFLKLDFENIPSSCGYLTSDNEKVEKFKREYFDNDNLKVGLFFVGGEQQKRNARYRAIELAKLSKLLELPNTKFYSFQKEDIYDELKDFPEIINLGANFNDFSDTAAAMKNLDVMVTIDSAPVHLAGALGIKTYLMLPTYSEWRWFTEEKTTPWYKSVELFRQENSSSWANVVDSIYEKLKNFKA